MIISGFHKDANPTPLLTWLSSFCSKSGIVYWLSFPRIPIVELRWYLRTLGPVYPCVLGFCGASRFATALHLSISTFSPSLSRHRFRLVTTPTLNFISKLLSTTWLDSPTSISGVNRLSDPAYGPKWAFDWLGSGTGAQEVKNPPSSRRTLPMFSPFPTITTRAECLVGVRRCRSSLHPRLHDAVRTNRVLRVKSLFLALVISI
jgi:hypothetical protein